MSRTRRQWLATAAAAGTLSLGLLAACLMPAGAPAPARASARLAGSLAAASHPAAVSHPAAGRPAGPAGTRPGGPAGTRPQARAGRVAIPGSHPAWAVADRRVTSRPVTRGVVAVRVYLAGRDMRGLAAFATAVSTPGNPAYRHYLTPAQARARFGPAPAQVATVRSWLRGAHMAVTAVHDPGAAGAYAAARGTVRAAARAFGVTFGQYRGPDGHMERAPAAAASIPAAAAADVLGVAGLSTAPAGVNPALAGTVPAQAGTAPALAAAARQPASPCSRYYGQRTAAGAPAAYGRHWPWRVCGYLPSQLRSAYGVTGESGQGQTIAIVDPYRSPTLLADADRYAREAGDVPLRSDQYQQYQVGPFIKGGPHECDAQGWYGEQTLDLEAVHGLAPGAVIRYVAAASCEDPGLIGALSLIVNRHLASIVSDSWGGLADSAGRVAVYNSIFQAGATEGIGFYFSSGDDGYNAPDENPKSPRIQVDFPTSSPWVTSVGGTSLAIGSHGQYLWETSWGNLADPLASGGRGWRYPPPGRYPEGYAGSGGGGVSTRFRQPSYQRGVVPLSLATRLPDGRRSAAPMRVVPDVAAVANPLTGMLVGQTVPRGGTGVFTREPVGGTSLACPVFAAIEADVQQATGYALGFANPAIYARAGTGAFHDLTDHPLGSVPLSAVGVAHEHPDTRTGPLVPSLIALGINGRGAAALRAVRGYDAATGVGSPWLYLQSFSS